MAEDPAIPKSDERSTSKMVGKRKIMQSEAIRQRNLGSKRRQNLAKFVNFCTKKAFCSAFDRTDSDFQTVQDFDHGYSDFKPGSEKDDKSSDFYREFFIRRQNLSYIESEDCYKQNLVHLNDDLDVENVDFIDSSSKFSNFDDHFLINCKNFAQKIKNLREKSSIIDQDLNSGEEYANFQTNLRNFALNLATGQSITSSKLSISLEKLVQILLDQRLAELSTENRLDRFNLRENNRLKNANRFRHSLNFAIGNKNLIQNLNYFLLEYLPVDLLSIYLGFLRVLVSKVPQFVARLIDNEVSTSNSAMVPSENDQNKEDKENQNDKKSIFKQILNEFFAVDVPGVLDLVLPDAKNPAELVKNPILVLISPNFKVFGQQTINLNERFNEFSKNLSKILGDFLEIKFEPFKKDTKFWEASKKLKNVVVEKLQEIRSQNLRRPIILLGYGPSSVLALNVALEHTVSAVVCFGMPNLTINGVRGDVDDDFLNLECPILFIIGQFASRSSLEDLQDMRKRIKSKNVGIILVGGASNDLKVSRQKLCSENLTQNIADKLIVNCTAEFLNEILLKTAETFSPGDEEPEKLDQPMAIEQPSKSAQKQEKEQPKHEHEQPRRLSFPAVRRTADLLAPPLASHVVALNLDEPEKQAPDVGNDKISAPAETKQEGLGVYSTI